MDRSCFFHEEKRTDVAIALKVLSDAYSDAYDHVILLTSDSDQVPTIQAVRDTFPQKRITVAIPPGRAAIARELAAIAHRHVEITPSRLAACMFGRNVYDASGKFVAAMPALYLEDERG